MSKANPSITVEVGDFSKALVGVTSVVAARNTVPILSNIMISQKSGTVRLCATDLDMEIWLSLAPASFSGEMATTVSGKFLAQIFRNLPSGAQATIAIDDHRKLIVTCGEGRFVLPTLPVDDFPAIAMMGDITPISYLAGDLLAILSRCEFAQSTEETRYYLNGINLHRTDDGSLAFTATDGHQLSHQVAGAIEPGVPDDFPNVIVARDTVSVMEKLLATLESEAMVDFEFTNSKFHCQMGDWHLTAKLVDGTFPDYKRVIPENNQIFVTLKKDVLQTLAKRVQILSSEKTRAIKCEFGKSNLVLTVQSPENGEAREVMAIEQDGIVEPLIIGMNGGYLIKQLSAHVSDDLVLKLSDPAAPIRIEGFGDSAVKGFLTVLMPMRV